MVATFHRIGRDVIVTSGHSGVPLAGSGRVTLAATRAGAFTDSGTAHRVEIPLATQARGSTR